MAKHPKSGKCVHCLKESDNLNSDHVFPASWYPDSTPNNQYKWQIPSCVECNSKYGVIEKDLLIRLGLCLDPQDTACRGIAEKALRSIDPNSARNEKDRQARLAKRRQIMSQTLEGDAIPNESIYPHFESRHAIPDSERMAVTISKKSIERLGEKIVRGILYLESGVYIDESYKIHVFALTDDGAAPFVELANKFGQAHSIGPGIEVIKATVADDGISSIFVVTIWGRFKTYILVDRTNNNHKQADT